MKKIFTLAAVLCAAISANAQTETWSVVNEDGTLKSEYVANPDPNQASVVNFATTNVSGTHVSGPVANFKDGETTPLEAQYDNTWSGVKKQDMSKDGSVAPFYYVQGKGNPVDLTKIGWEEIETDGVGTGVYRANWNDAYYNPDGTTGVPTNGTYVTVKAKVDGTMKVGVWINKGNREIFVAKGSDAKALAMGTDVIVSGYVQATNNDVAEDSPLYGYMLYQENIAMKGAEGMDAYIVGAGNRPAWVYLTWNAKANETYYVFNKSTQVGFSGIEFTAAGEGGVESIAAAIDENAPIYNALGQRVSKDAKGILIQNGRKFIRK